MIHWSGKYPPEEGFMAGAEWGAAWAFAIVGMGMAIQERDAERKVDATIRDWRELRDRYGWGKEGGDDE